MSDVAMQEKRKTELLEELAALEHEQWRKWAYAILDEERISEPRAKRWLKILQAAGYKNLTEEQKYQDREWAERVLSIIKRHMGIR